MDEVACDDTADLPSSLAEIARVIGRDAALRLAVERGGTAIFIPSPPLATNHWLSRLIGHEAAMKLSTYLATGSATAKRKLGGCEIVIASAANLRRKEQLQGLIRLGFSGSKIARLAGVTTRTVSRHRARMREEQEQL